MRRISEHLRAHMYKELGLLDPPSPKAGNTTFEELLKSEWSPEFERKMRNRLVVGAIRYGRLGASDKPQYDNIGAIKDRASKYLDSGNLELLVDISNLALIEFVEGRHPNRHFEPGDDGEHVSEL